MAKDQRNDAQVRDMSDVVSVIGPGMEIVGDIKCDGTVRVEGRVEGAIRASKAVVIGKGGRVDGDIETQDVVVAGSITGTVVAASRVELQESCRVEGDIRSRRIKLDEGGRVEGRLHMGAEAGAKSAAEPRKPALGADRKESPEPAAAAGGPNLSAAVRK